MNVTKQLNQFIAENGSNARDALNVALARLAVAERKLGEFQVAVDWRDCPKCDGIIIKGWRCLNCYYDESVDDA